MYVNLKLNLTYPLEMPINKRSIRLSIAHTLTVIRLSRLFLYIWLIEHGVLNIQYIHRHRQDTRTWLLWVKWDIEHTHRAINAAENRRNRRVGYWHSCFEDDNFWYHSHIFFRSVNRVSCCRLLKQVKWTHVLWIGSCGEL